MQFVPHRVPQWLTCKIISAYVFVHAVEDAKGKSVAKTTKCSVPQYHLQNVPGNSSSTKNSPNSLGNLNASPNCKCSFVANNPACNPM